MTALHPDIAMAAEHGLQLFPCVWPVNGRCSCGDAKCDNIAKHPKIKGWQQYATTETEILAQWCKTWPLANWGVVTGRPSSVIVIDVDPRHGGDETLADLERQHGPVPNTWTALSGGGGRHLWFLHPGTGDTRNSAGVIGPGIDVRGDGGFIMVPPSVHLSGRVYAWDVDHHPDDAALADVPDWILERNDRPHVAATAAPVEWQARVATEVPEGQRNDRLAKLAGHLLRRHVDPYVALELLQSWNIAKCRPPIGSAELQATVASIARRELARRQGRNRRT